MLLCCPVDIIVVIMNYLQIDDLIVLISTCRKLRHIAAKHIRLIYHLNENPRIVPAEVILTLFPQLLIAQNVILHLRKQKGGLWSLFKTRKQSAEQFVANFITNCDSSKVELTFAEYSTELIPRAVLNQSKGVFRCINKTYTPVEGFIVDHNRKKIYLDNIKMFEMKSSQSFVRYHGINLICLPIVFYKIWSVEGERNFDLILIEYLDRAKNVWDNYTLTRGGVNRHFKKRISFILPVDSASILVKASPIKSELLKSKATTQFDEVLYENYGMARCSVGDPHFPYLNMSDISHFINVQLTGAPLSN